MLSSRFTGIAALLLVTTAALACFAAETLGDPPPAPKDVTGLPGAARRESVTGGFAVNTDSREEVRSFYNAIYTTSDGVPMNSTAEVSTCTAGTNSSAFQEAVLRRINWFRAMAGVPASVTFGPSNNAADQQAALILSANDALSHFPAPSWSCFSGGGANAASNSNLSLGSSGAIAIGRYMLDFGANNAPAGHRRWILYPQTQVMGTGDVPAQGTNSAANSTWVFDSNLFGPRPSTRQPYVAWPPRGFVPYSLVYPRWSFALSNADFSAATVMMTSNGATVALSLESYTTGYGENTLVWVPSGLDPANLNTTFPFGGTDTSYSITVTNIKVGPSTVGYNYSVTLFDPAIPGGDYVVQSSSGPTQAMVNLPTSYTCQPANNSHVTSYQWRVSQRVSGNLSDGAEAGLTNFTPNISPGYSAITNTVAASGTHSFYLAHPTGVAQLLQLNRVLAPASNTVLTFKSRLAYATTSEVARVQVSLDSGNTWQNIYSQSGTGGAGESSFALRTAPLSNYTGQAVLLRFNYDRLSGAYFNSINPGVVGWSFDDVVISNAEQLVNAVTNITVTTNFTFMPAQSGNYNELAEHPLGDRSRLVPIL